jgi:hypothetical protein
MCTGIRRHLFIAIIVWRSRRIVLTWVAEPKTKVCDGVVAFGVLYAFGRIAETVLSDAVIEAAALHGFRRDSDDVLYSGRSIHYG